MGISLDEVAAKLGSIADGIGDAAVNVGNTVIDLATGYNLAERSRVGGAQEFGNEQREGIYGEQADLRSRFAGGWDAQQFVEESFDSMSHEQIMASVDRMDPAAVSASAEGWTAIGSALAEGLDGFKSAILTEIGAGWEGAAAASATKATGDYVTASDQLAAAGSLVGSKVAEAATGITQVKATVPPPEHTSLGETVFDLVSPGTAIIKGLLHERNEAREQAVQIMKTVYSPVMRQADTQVPTLPSPTSVTGATATGNPGSGADAAGTSGYGNPTGYGIPAADAGGTSAPGGGTTSGSDSGTTGATESADGPGAAEDTASGASDGAASNPDGADPSTGGLGSDSVFAQSDPSSVWTRPAGAGVDGAVPGAGGYGAGTGTQGGSGGGYGGVGAGSVGGGGSGGVGSATGGGSFGGGTGMIAVPGGSAAAGNAGGPTAAAGAAGRPGMPGTGMMPAGARGHGDDDTEHATPGYLVNVDNGNDLVGDLPLVAPPVLGA